MIDKQLGGKIDRHWIETGLMMIITVPVPGSDQNKRGRWC
jgi:hypothetical protein